MKKTVMLLLCMVILTACSSEDTKMSETTKKPDLQLGNQFLTDNELSNKGFKIHSLETNWSKAGKYYYQVNITNTSTQSQNLTIEQLVLVDTLGIENHVQMIDQDLISPYQANQSKTGIIAFDDLGEGKPKFLRLKE